MVNKFKNETAALIFLLVLVGSFLTTTHAEKTIEPPLAAVAVAPGYPLLALHTGTSGEVKVRVTVDADGTVISADVISGHQLLRQSCREAAMQWKFASLESGAARRETELTFVFLIAPKGTTTAKLTTVFKQPNRIEMTRVIPEGTKSTDPRGKVKR